MNVIDQSYRTVDAVENLSNGLRFSPPLSLEVKALIIYIISSTCVP